MAEVTEEAVSYLPMNINVTNGVIRGTVSQAAQSQVSNEDIGVSRSPSVSALANTEEGTTFEIFAEKMRGGKQKVTVNTVGTTH